MDPSPRAGGSEGESFSPACLSRTFSILGHSSVKITERPLFTVGMKKTLHIDESLLREARSASGAKTDTDTVRLGLEALVRRGAYERLRALRGSEPHAREVPRRRERSSSARPRHSAA